MNWRGPTTQSVGSSLRGCGEIGKKTAVSHLTGQHILEIAHGPGHMLLELERQGFTAVGLDLSPAMSRQAQRRLHQANSPIPLLQAQVQALPFATATFDAVLSTFPTDFIVEPATIRQLHHVLRPQGRVVILLSGEPTGPGPATRFIHWLFRITSQTNQANQPDDWDTHPLWLTFQERYQQVGFTLTLQRVILGDSLITLLIAHK